MLPYLVPAIWLLDLSQLQQPVYVGMRVKACRSGRLHVRFGEFQCALQTRGNRA